jgi:hypothetical protein
MLLNSLKCDKFNDCNKNICPFNECYITYDFKFRFLDKKIKKKKVKNNITFI